VLDEQVTLIADRSWPDGRSLFYEVSPDRRWVPALADRGPALYAHDDSLLVLVVSALRASGPRDWHDDNVRYGAGSVLRRLDDAESFGPFEDIAAAKQAEVENWARRVKASSLRPSSTSP
jgi:hypothetical protein